MRKRNHPDYEIQCFRYAITPIGELPQAVWDAARAKQALWNRLVALREETMPNYLPQRETMSREEKKTFWSEFTEAARALTASSKVYWADASDVLDRFLTAHQRGFKTDAGAPKARHGLQRIRLVHRFTGGGWDIRQITSPRAGRFAFQCLPNARHYEYNVRAARNARLANARFQVGEKSVPLRVNVHRALPREGLVKTAALCGEFNRLARQWTWHIVITVETPPQNKPPRSPRRAGLDLGWRKFDGYIRIGYVVDDDENEIELRLPLDFSTKQARHQGYPCTHAELAELESSIALDLEAVKARLRELGVVPASLTQMRQGGLKKFLRELEQREGELLPQEFRALEVLREWRHTDERKQVRYNRSAARFLERRRWLYRNLADWLTRTYGVIAWEGDLSVKQMAEQKIDTSEPEGRALKAGMTYRQIAAIGELREYLRHAASKNNARLFDAKTAHSTTTCGVCGEQAEASAALFLQCPNGHEFDQDANAASNLLSQIPADVEAETDFRENEHKILPIPHELAAVAVYVHSIE
jgi:transposase